MKCQVLFSWKHMTFENVLVKSFAPSMNHSADSQLSKSCLDTKSLRRKKGGMTEKKIDKILLNLYHLLLYTNQIKGFAIHFIHKFAFICKMCVGKEHIYQNKE